MDFPGTRFSRGTPRLSRRAFLLGSAQLVAGTAAFLLIRQGADAATVSVKDHGAAGDGVQNDAPEIQKAIDKAPLGATVHFPAGTYALYDALYPRSGVNIEFAPGAKVIQRGVQHIFVFRNVSNIVTRNLRMRHEGSGTIANPMLWDGASHLTHYDTTIERTDAWCGYLKGGSHHITIDGYYVLTANAKTDNIDDGIDFVDCHDITLRKFDIKTNDDAIAFHSWGGGVYNVHIENGYVQSRTSGGVAFGNAISATIRDCTIKNVVARDTRVPVYFKGTEASNTGEVYNISFEDISIFDNIGRTHSGVFFHTVSARAGKAH
ncbi:MAG TPA: glycosyl hydrolase family 28-related protein, partial [Dehalococcoidia bacterium]|nr:glycosyl hydrolase family 28-related protein [Dehalococcoidia bacterium]